MELYLHSRCAFMAWYSSKIFLSVSSQLCCCYLSAGFEYYPVDRLTHSDDDVDNNDNDNSLICEFVKESRNDAFNYIYCRISRWVASPADVFFSWWRRSLDTVTWTHPARHLYVERRSVWTDRGHSGLARWGNVACRYFGKVGKRKWMNLLIWATNKLWVALLGMWREIYCNHCSHWIQCLYNTLFPHQGCFMLAVGAL